MSIKEQSHEILKTNGKYGNIHEIIFDSTLEDLEQYKIILDYFWQKILEYDSSDYHTDCDCESNGVDRLYNNLYSDVQDEIKELEKAIKKRKKELK